MEFKEGIYENLDYPTYDSIPAWRSHDLTDISKCPFTWKHKVFDSESPALLEGRAQPPRAPDDQHKHALAVISSTR